MANTERIYVIVPETVQTPFEHSDASGFSEPEFNTCYMSPGRLMAQSFHAARILQQELSYNLSTDYRDITTIVLSVRNSKELRKVSNELLRWHDENPDVAAFVEFCDENLEFYGTVAKVHTATAIGPVADSMVLDEIIGHLELY